MGAPGEEGFGSVDELGARITMMPSRDEGQQMEDLLDWTLLRAAQRDAHLIVPDITPISSDPGDIEAFLKAHSRWAREECERVLDEVFERTSGLPASRRPSDEELIAFSKSRTEEVF